jgi:hypothetical protein
VSIKFNELLRRDPIFGLLRTSYCLDLELSKVIAFHLEFGNKSCSARFYVPVTGDLPSILFILKPDRKLAAPVTEAEKHPNPPV